MQQKWSNHFFIKLRDLLCCITLPADLTCKLNMNADSGHWQLYLKTAVLHIGIRALHGHCNKEKSWLRPCMQYSRFFLIL